MNEEKIEYKYYLKVGVLYVKYFSIENYSNEITVSFTSDINEAKEYNNEEETNINRELINSLGIEVLIYVGDEKQEELKGDGSNE